jgi:hypothetical protein
MPTESGDRKVIDNYRQLIDHVTANPDYNPANSLIAKAALATHRTAAFAADDAVDTSAAPYKMAVTARQEVFDPVSTVMRRSFAMLKASGASQGELDDAKTELRKITGARKSPKKKAGPNTPAAEVDKQHSASQMSYANRRGSVGAYVSILANVSSYNPNEDELKLSALQALVADLDAKNDAVSAAFVPLSQARGARDAILYLDEDSVVNRAALVKAYVAAAFGRDSQLYKAIKGLDFRRPHR